MRDPHLNIFCSDRGPSGSEDASVRQLEDNLTRALIITINSVTDLRVRGDLLEMLAVPETSRQDQIYVQLQVSEPLPGWLPRSSRSLLVIHGGPDLVVVDGPACLDTGRADATVFVGNSLVNIESKLGNRMDRDQLVRHCETLDISPSAISDVTWTILTRRL